MSILDDYVPGGFLNRTLCDVLTDMRKCFKELNFATIPGLIEEAQVMGNKMEASLEDAKDLQKIRQQIKEGRKELKRLRKQIKKEKK